MAMDDLDDMADSLPSSPDTYRPASNPWDAPNTMRPLNFTRQRSSFSMPRYSDIFRGTASSSQSSFTIQHSQSSPRASRQQKRSSSQEPVPTSPAAKRMKQEESESNNKTENFDEKQHDREGNSHTQVASPQIQTPCAPPSDPVAALRFLADRMAGYNPIQAKRLRVLARVPANRTAYSAEIKGFAVAHQRRLDQQVQRAETHRQELQLDGQDAEAEVKMLLQAEKQTKYRRDVFKAWIKKAKFE